MNPDLQTALLIAAVATPFVILLGIGLVRLVRYVVGGLQGLFIKH